MSSIFELTTNQAQLMKSVELGEISKEDAADTFEGMQGELNDKINDYCRVRNRMIGELGNIETEMERLKDLKERKQKQIDSLTSSLKYGLENVGESRFDTGLFVGHFRKGSVSLKVNDASKVPDGFVTTKVTESVDKTALKKAIQLGEVECEGVELITGESSLIIK